MPTLSNSATIPFEPASIELPMAIAAIERAWNGYQEAAEHFSSKIDVLRANEIRERGKASDTTYGLVLNPYYISFDYAKVADAALEAVLEFATEYFAPAGAKLSLNKAEIVRSCRIENRSENYRMDVAALWRYLHSQFNGEKALKHVYRAVADGLIDDFNLKSGEDQKVVAGRVVLETWICRGSMDSGIDSRDQEKLGKILANIATVCLWAGIWQEDEATDLRTTRAMITEAQRYGGTPPTRANITNLVLIVPRLKRWEFRLSPVLAEQMQLFIAEFGSREAMNR